MTRTDLILDAMLRPQLLVGMSSLDWDLLVRQGRATYLLARLAHILVEKGLIDSVPIAPRQHFIASLVMASRHDIAVQWEVDCISAALRDVEVKVTLLKGAAYVMIGCNAAQGRTFSDVDILVPKEKIGHTESELMIHGWQGGHHDPYDQRYYRRWMHEIPPMRHVRRGTTIDVHHTILPETARVKVDARALLDGVVAVPGYKNLFTLKPTDMVLHSATHLFHEGDLDKGLRDLFDLDSLLREFAAKPGFYEQLVPRAVSLGLTRPLFYALRYTKAILGTPMPESVYSASNVGSPNWLILFVMDACYFRALRPTHVSTTSFSNRFARFALYVRSHWVRMPFHLLVYHLARKALAQKEPQLIEKPIINAEV